MTSARHRHLDRLLVLREAVVLVWRAAPTLVLQVAALQVVLAASTAAQVLAVRALLADLVAAEGTGPALAGELVESLAALTALLVLAAGASAVALQRQRLLGEVVQVRVWDQVLAASTEVHLLEFEEPAFHDQLERVKTESVARPVAVTGALVALLGGALTVAAVMVGLFAVEPLLAPVPLLAALPLLVGQRANAQLAYSFAFRTSALMRRRDYYQQLLTRRDTAQEVRAYGSGPHLRDDHERLSADWLQVCREEARTRALVTAAAAGGAAAITGGVLGLLALMVAKGQVSLAGAGAALLALRLLASRVDALVGGLGQLYEASLFLEELRALSAYALEDNGPQGDPTALRPFQRLAVQDVSFRYPSQERLALDGVSFDVERGQVVALVGENGSGKTTLAKVLSGLYPPEDGRVLWDERDLHAMGASEARSGVAWVFQDFVRYRLPVRDNVALGRPDEPVDDQLVEQALRQAGLLDAVRSLPRGLDTVLSPEYEDGADLSGGQWQRMALARAFYRQAHFLVLDEPSAALDPRAEHDLFRDLRQGLAGRTALFISHRFTTVRSADLILVLRQGRLVEAGTHADLVALGGYYAELHTLQEATLAGSERLAGTHGQH